MIAQEQHLSYRDIMRILSVSKSKAYEIIHECESMGCVVAHHGMVRLAASGFEAWYKAHLKTGEASSGQQQLDRIIAEGEMAVQNSRRRAGRPRKELWKDV